MKNCLYCGKEFEPSRSDQVFCSKACKVQSNRKARKGDVVTDNVTDNSPDVTDKSLPVNNQGIIGNKATPVSVTDNAGKHFDTEGREFTKTDWLFQQDIIKCYKDDQLFKDPEHWYKFGKLRLHIACWACNKPFDTRLPLNRYCSPKCRDKDSAA